MPFSDAELEGFLDEALPAERMTAVESRLRTDPALAARVAAIVGRRDAGVHSLAGVWRRRRLTCLSRQQLGSLLLGVMEPELADYVRFHLEVVGCRLCQANLDDLRSQHEAADQSLTNRRRARYFQSSAGYLSPSDE
jgi:hypothetical protein